MLDNKIDECAELVRQYYSIEDFGDPGAPSQEDLVYIGRLQPELSEDTDAIEPAKHAASQKLSLTAMTLETSRLLGAGSRIPLRFEKDARVRGADDGQGGVGLFAGMIVAVKGRNAGGNYLGVNEVIVVRLAFTLSNGFGSEPAQLPPLDLPESSPADLLTYQYDAGTPDKPKLNGQPVSVATACGPYTTDDNLDYGPLDALCEELKSSKPDVLILVRLT